MLIIFYQRNQNYHQQANYFPNMRAKIYGINELETSYCSLGIICLFVKLLKIQNKNTIQCVIPCGFKRFPGICPSLRRVSNEYLFLK